MKARFLEPQPLVRIVEPDGRAYVFLCLNEEQKTEEFDGTPTTHYEYDYNEIVSDQLDLDDVREHPERYIAYAAEEEKPLVETVKEQAEQIQMLTECLLEVSETIYA